MLYLIQSLVEEIDGSIIKLLKIGYASDVEERMKTYYTCCPGTVLLATREGDKDLEHLFHLRYKSSRYEFKGVREWFYLDVGIIKEFRTLGREELIESTPEYLQEKYENYFTKNILTSFSDLYKKYHKGLMEDLEAMSKENPELSEFFNKWSLRGRFGWKLRRVQSLLLKYLRGVDYQETLRKGGESLEFTDSGISCLFESILEDIKQGNPKITIHHKTPVSVVEEYYEDQKKKMEVTKDLLNLLNKATGSEKLAYLSKFERGSELYDHDFVDVSKKNNTLIYNHLIEEVDSRAWKVSLESLLPPTISTINIQ